jgi:hypothetical protein
MERDPETNRNEQTDSGEKELLSRREFLAGLGKWSKIVLGAALAGGALLAAEQEAQAYGSAWANRGGGGGGGWANRGGGGGGAWANRGGGGGAWGNHGGGGGWVNRYGGGGAWVNHGGGAWANGGGVWVNGGGSWINRY